MEEFRIDYADCDQKKINMILEKHGFCVVENVIEKDNCIQYISKIWDWLENLESGIDRTDSKTWTNKYWMPSSNGIINYLGVGHAQFVWDIRTNDKVIDVFSKIWGTDDLYVSFDGINVMRPSEHIKSENWDSWFHFDQSSYKKNRCCIQGFLNLEDATESDGTVVVVPKSHLFRNEFFEKFGISTWNNHVTVTKEQFKWFTMKGLYPKTIPLKAGSLMLWDSRTMHCNKSPDMNRSEPKFRYVVYLCMTPKSMTSEDDITIRKLAFLNRQMTSHWPYDVYVIPEIDDITIKKLRLDRFKPKDDLKTNEKILNLAY